MKQSYHASNLRSAAARSLLALPRYMTGGRRRLGLFILLFALIHSGCQKQATAEAEGLQLSPKLQAADVLIFSQNAIQNDKQFRNYYTGLEEQTLWELQQARAATARYRHLDNALKDGYVDIHAVIPNMGHHFLKGDIVDGTFDPRKPEILVYQELSDGSFQLVAVEYAVPIALSPNGPPQGFSGSDDEWDRNDELGLWLLHAWVWYHNPDGVFHHTNSRVVIL